jgi:hypothetical protein
MDVKKAQELLEKVKELKDLRHAIDMVRAEGLNKDENLLSSLGNGGTLSHLGIHELAPNILTHILGTGDKDTHHYHCNVDLLALSEGMPHINVKIVDHTGRPLSEAPKVYNNIKDAVTDIVHHFNRREWNHE